MVSLVGMILGFMFTRFFGFTSTFTGIAISSSLNNNDHSSNCDKNCAIGLSVGIGGFFLLCIIVFLYKTGGCDRLICGRPICERSSCRPDCCETGNSNSRVLSSQV